MSDETRQCGGQVWEPRRLTPHGCSNPATVEHEGRWWCTKHSPSYEQGKRDRWNRWYAATTTAERRIRNAKYAIEELVKAHPDFKALRDELLTAEGELAKAEKIKKEPMLLARQKGAGAK